MWAFIHTGTVIDSPDPHTVRRLSVACAESLRALADAIPCHACAAAYRAALEVLPPPDAAAMALFRWGWELHNAVNEKLGRPAMSPHDGPLRDVGHSDSLNVGLGGTGSNVGSHGC